MFDQRDIGILNYRIQFVVLRWYTGFLSLFPVYRRFFTVQEYDCTAYCTSTPVRIKAVLSTQPGCDRAQTSTMVTVSVK